MSKATFVSLLFFVFPPFLYAQPASAIKVDQVGYLTDAPKVAFVVSDRAAGQFAVIRESDGRAVLRGALGPTAEDADSGDGVREADFSTVKATGTYVLEVEGVGRSWPFAIGPDVYRRAYYLAMRSYYGQRCGTAVDLGPAFPGYRHGACHTVGAFHPSSGRTGPHASARGWHDAGDYGRYVVNSGITTGTLLWTYEMFGDRIGRMGLDLPESGNNTPDLLDEVRWNLDWMLSMQDQDGGVWHKQTSEAFAGFVMPEADHSTSDVIGTGAEPFKSSCATADLAAVAAIASRTFEPFDRAYAARAGAAARLAWTWVSAHPDVLFRNPPGVTTGAYGDRSCGDERLWAAAELWRTTGDRVYDDYVKTHVAEFLPAIRPAGPPSWGSVAALGLWSYAMAEKSDADVVSAIRKASIDAADGIAARTAADPYRVSLTTPEYVWGSNGVVANYALQLLVANRLSPDPKYTAAALDDLHYLLGRNTFSLSFVTGVGAHAFMHPHHRPSAADGLDAPWPGLLAGGPNGHRQDQAMQKLPADLPPAKMYLDETASYATNEIAINWNAPLVLVLAAMVAR